MWAMSTVVATVTSAVTSVISHLQLHVHSALQNMLSLYRANVSPTHAIAPVLEFSSGTEHHSSYNTIYHGGLFIILEHMYVFLDTNYHEQDIVKYWSLIIQHESIFIHQMTLYYWLVIITRHFLLQRMHHISISAHTQHYFLWPQFIVLHHLLLKTINLCKTLLFTVHSLLGNNALFIYCCAL